MYFVGWWGWDGGATQCDEGSMVIFKLATHTDHSLRSIACTPIKVAVSVALCIIIGGVSENVPRSVA